MLITELPLNQDEKHIVSKLRSSFAYLRDNYPEELSHALGDVVVGVDVVAQTTNSLVGYFTKYLQKMSVEGEDAITASENFLSDLSINIENELSRHLDEIDNRSLPFEGQVIPRGEFLEPNNAFVSADGTSRSCFLDCTDPNVCDNPAVTVYSDCYTECECAYGGTSEAWDNEDDGNWFGNFFSTATTALGNIASEIGWDNIWGGLMGTNDDGSGDTTVYVIDDEDDDDDDEEGFNWLALGIGVLVTAAVVGGVVYFVRKSKAD